MRDLNFFRAYVEKNNLKVKWKIIYILIGFMIIILFLINTTTNHIIIKQEEKAILTLKSIAEDPKNLERIEQIKAKERDVEEFRELVEKINLLDSNFNEFNIINRKLFDEVNENMPPGLFINSITMGMYEVYIVGVAEDKSSIAKFGRGLEAIYDLGDVFVSNISSSEGGYRFNINIMVRDVNIDEESKMELYEFHSKGDKI